MMLRRLATALLASASLTPLAAHAQALPAPATFVPDSAGVYPWRWSFFPTFGGGTNDGPLFGVRARGFQMAEYADRIANRQSITAVAGASVRGSFLGFLRYQAPRIGTGWRFWAQAQANREVRFGYFGLGNNTLNDRSLADSTTPFPYRARRTRFEVRTDLTRRLTGPLSVALGLHAQLARFGALEGSSAFRTEFGSTLEQDDASARLALVADTRDVEYDPTRGVLLEAGAQVGAGNGGYERLYGVLRGYAPLGSKTVLAGRLAGTHLSGTPTLDARFVLPAWEQPVDLLGGQFSHRGLEFGRLAGRSALFANAEVRQEVKNIRGALDLVVVGFVDAGRVFETESFSLTTADLKAAVGVGAGVKILRSSVFVLNIAKGPEGWRVSANNGWQF